MSTTCLTVVYFISILVYSQYAMFYKYHCSFLCILYNVMLYKLDKSEITLTFAIFTFIILIESKSFWKLRISRWNENFYLLRRGARPLNSSRHSRDS